MGPTGDTQVVQIHPTRRCNLRCRHCYSSSSPQARDTLSPHALMTTLEGLAAEGYDWASFSGGEPTLYKPLPLMLRHAQELGMRTAIVSNGLPLTPNRLDAIKDATDLLVISVDGKPASHNRLRNNARAFDTMTQRLPEVRARDIDFGILFTLTQYNLDELPWVAEFAANIGAKLLQIHPLEDFGNAARQLAGEVPDATEGAYAWMLADKLREQLDGRMALQVDLLHNSALNAQPNSFFLGDFDEQRHRPLGEQLTPLIVEDDGEVVPLQYGFSRDYSLGNITRHSMRDMANRWRERIGPRLHTLSTSLRDALADEPPGFINWYERMAEQARPKGAPLPHTIPLNPVALKRPHA